ncbi:hypothetical protein ACQEPB_00430 [Novosphingobium fluoreni]|uniref:hypothetical protein n=1 Tax=Novosphingobium fluoreni TaxID=1391222 RepID=UPI003DA00B63
MAQRGAKPKPAHLHIVQGTRNVTRHGSEESLRERVEGAAAAFGGLKRPSYLRGEARKAWDRYVAPADWLDASREPAAIMFCELWQEFRDAPRSFTAGKHGQMRSLMNELGLTDERNRGGGESKKTGDEFFD